MLLSARSSSWALLTAVDACTLWSNCCRPLPGCPRPCCAATTAEAASSRERTSTRQPRNRDRRSLGIVGGQECWPAQSAKGACG